MYFACFTESYDVLEETRRLGRIRFFAWYVRTYLALLFISRKAVNVTNSPLAFWTIIKRRTSANDPIVTVIRRGYPLRV